MRQEVMSFLRGLLLHWRGEVKIIALSSLTERGKKRKPERKNIGIAANLIKMLVASTYGLHYGIRLTVVTPIGLDRRFLVTGGGLQSHCALKTTRATCRWTLATLWCGHYPNTFPCSPPTCTPVWSSTPGLECLQMSLSHLDDTPHA